MRILPGLFLLCKCNVSLLEILNLKLVRNISLDIEVKHKNEHFKNVRTINILKQGTTGVAFQWITPRKR